MSAAALPDTRGLGAGLDLPGCLQPPQLGRAKLAAVRAAPCGPAGLDDPEDDDGVEIEPRDLPEDESFETATPAPAKALGETLDDGALAALIARIGERNQKALEALYNATSSRVYGLVLRITQQRALAEEVVEDTFWQVWRQALRFDAGRGKPMTWLLSMARSRAIDAMRRDQRFAHDELPEEGAAESADTFAAPQDLLDATRNAQALHGALAQLDARSRQLVSLAFFRGLTHDEIAEHAQLPLGTVKSLIRRAMLQLRQALLAPLGGRP